MLDSIQALFSDCDYPTARNKGGSGIMTLNL